MAAYVYLLHCADGSYYTGWTVNPARRLTAHQAGRGARYTRARRPVALVYLEACADATAARQREYRLRHTSHAAKRALARAHPPPAPLPGAQPEEAASMAQLTQLSVTEFLEALASASPTPGGGSASALGAAMGAAMVEMACNLTVGREKFAAVEAELRDVLAQASAARGDLTAAVDDDTTAYAAVSAAYKLPRNSDEEKAQRTAVIQGALEGACEVPLRVARRAAEVVRLSRIAQAKANPNVASDALVAELLARAGMDGAIANVEINLGAIKNAAFTERMRAAIDEIRAGAHA